MTSEDPRPAWKHRPGDRYAVIISRVVGDTRSGFHFADSMLPDIFSTISRAKAAGMRFCGSDDFNIGAIREGRLAALLWTREVVDDDPKYLASLEEALELQAVLAWP